mmetsp:Transcript_28677/g.93120  ORF Transcript_28677/g.93120 Transcript_28677/m.93120 type:complete len:538 (-) Transcript_28677:193-1806(-)
MRTCVPTAVLGVLLRPLLPRRRLQAGALNARGGGGRGGGGGGGGGGGRLGGGGGGGALRLHQLRRPLHRLLQGAVPRHGDGGVRRVLLRVSLRPQHEHDGRDVVAQERVQPRHLRAPPLLRHLDQRHRRARGVALEVRRHQHRLLVAKELPQPVAAKDEELVLACAQPVVRHHRIADDAHLRRAQVAHRPGHGDARRLPAQRAAPHTRGADVAAHAHVERRVHHPVHALDARPLPRRLRLVVLRQRHRHQQPVGVAVLARHLRLPVRRRLRLRVRLLGLRHRVHRGGSRGAGSRGGARGVGGRGRGVRVRCVRRVRRAGLATLAVAAAAAAPRCLGRLLRLLGRRGLRRALLARLLLLVANARPPLERAQHAARVAHVGDEQMLAHHQQDDGRGPRVLAVEVLVGEHEVLQLVHNRLEHGSHFDQLLATRVQRRARVVQHALARHLLDVPHQNARQVRLAVLRHEMPVRPVPVQHREQVPVLVARQPRVHQIRVLVALDRAVPHAPRAAPGSETHPHAVLATAAAAAAATTAGGCRA